MGYELFAYAIVVALMAIYIYNNERRMGEMIFKLDQTGHMTCEEGWRLYGEHFYYFSKNKRSWHAAKDECRRKGGHLVKVEGQAENDWLLTVWKELDLLYPWIGANDIQKTGSWKWESDQASLSYTFWGPSEPNNNQGIEHCGHFWFVKTGEWNDSRCIESLSYICEKP